MAKGHKPKAGSRAFWHRKRAKRMYPRVRISGMEKLKGQNEPKPVLFAGYKAGMTRVMFTDSRKESPTSGQDITSGVTIIDCPPVFVFGIKLYRKTAGRYRNTGTIMSKNLKPDLKRKISAPKKEPVTSKHGEADDIRLLVHTQPRESGLSKKRPEIFEIDIAGNDPKQKLEYAKGKLGKVLEISEVLEEGEYVDTKAIDKGKGFQGPVKRFGVTIRSRKNKGKRRHVGNIGAVTPGRVLPGKITMPGQMGFQARTEFNKRVVKIGNDGISSKSGLTGYGSVPKGYLLVEGSVPGPKKRLIFFRKSLRKEKKQPLEIKQVLGTGKE